MKKSLADEIKRVELTRYEKLPIPLRVWFLIVSTVGILFAIYFVFSFSFGGTTLNPYAYYYMLMACYSSSVFLIIPARKKEAEVLPWYDIVATLLTFIIASYFVWNAWNIGNVGWVPPSIFQFVLALLFSLLILEGGRRMAGNVYTVVCIFFGLYPLFAGHMPGLLFGYSLSLEDTIATHVFGGEGMVGLPSKIMGDLLIGFLLFAGVLLASGAGHFFINIALALFGRFRGGPAKVAVVASAFFGTVSGSAVANVVGTGSITIPTMKRLGYPPHYAGAIEACASTGGILMPPVMGAVAFVMAAFLSIEYRQVCVAAAIPAILYYAALLFQVDFFAARTGLKGLPREELPSLGETLKTGWIFFAVLLFLIWGLLIMQWESYTPYYASVLMFALSFLRKKTMMTPKKIVATMATVGQMVTQTMAVMIPIAFIISGLVVSGTSASFTAGLVTLGGGNVLIILVLGAVACYILGMAGMMISAYIFLAVTLAPAVIQVGNLNPIAVHLFILYFVMLSCITPPVAVASFVGAAIAGAEPMKTALTSMRLGIVVYFLPFFFVYNPALILQGKLEECLYNFGTALCGSLFLAVALENYLWILGKLPHWVMRPIFFFSGLLILFPEKYSDMAGFFIVAITITVGIVLNKRRTVVKKDHCD
jgi:TRAP transporter 4TM/12TM fusion protein